ncbi:MAG TPA: hypothetical protein VFT43_09690 [Candidatus Polarisedimenticolia bacterium]|nr:hypothetical protein [Candidatus Polarisedimenticolia bacterium]
MKTFLLCVVCLWPATLVLAEETYTNADLVKFQVPGAYTNEDLKGLPPLAVQRQPAALTPRFEPAAGAGDFYQVVYDNLKRDRESLAAELQFEKDRVAYSESAFAGDSQGWQPRLGYATRVRPLLLELGKRVALLDFQMESVIDQARRAGATIDLR